VNHPPTNAAARAGTRRTLLTAALVAATMVQAGCGVLAVGGIGAAAMAASDRRTIGTQTEDQTIEIKAMQELSRLNGRISVTSFNRKVLLTGQVPNDATRRQAATIAAGISQVASLHNELQVGGVASFGTQAADTSLTTQVKGAFVNAADLQTNSIKVVTEAGVVYLMGIVTRTEGERAAQVASRVSGVRRVVTVFEYVTPDELARIERQAKESKSGESKPQ